MDKRPSFLFIGGAGPMRYVLERAVTMKAMHCCALVTDLGVDPDLEALATSNKMKLVDTPSLKDPTACPLKPFGADWILSVHCLAILSDRSLKAATEGCLNLHPAKLPEYGGRYTNQWAIRNGETEGAVTVHWMDVGVDSGPIAFQKPIPIHSDDTGGVLHHRLWAEGAKLVVEAVEHIVSGKSVPKTPQDLSRRRLYLLKEAKNSRLDLSWNAKQVYDFVRAADYRPKPPQTYSPQLKTGSGILHLVSTEISDEKHSELPGTILDLLPEGFLLAVGNGESVIVKEAMLGSPLVGSQISSTCKLNKGDKLVVG